MYNGIKLSVLEGLLMERIVLLMLRYAGSFFLMGIGGIVYMFFASMPEPGTVIAGLILLIAFIGAGVAILVETIIRQVKTYVLVIDK